MASLPYRQRPQVQVQQAPPSPASPASPPFSSPPHQKEQNSTSLDVSSTLPTPPITPVKPAQAPISRVDSIDLERDAALPIDPKPFVGDLQRGIVLGEGQWARVFYGQTTASGRACAVAVKVPRPSKSGEPARVLKHEACVFTFLTHQPRATEHIVPFYGLESISEGLVLEYAPHTLETLIQAYPAGTPLDTDPIIGPRPFLSLARSLVSSLAWIHAHGVIHGDIKPRNILCSSLDSVRLGDFSSARLVSDTDPRPGDTCTTTYAAPELLRSFRSTRAGVPTVHSDIWGIAATLLFAGTGEEPYADIPTTFGRLAEAQRGTAWQHMRNGRNIGRVRQDGVLWRALSGVLMREESERWSVREWIGAVEALEADERRQE